MTKLELILITIIILSSMFSYMIGFTNGMNKSQEIRKQVDCEMTHYKSFQDIPGDCIKYIIKK